MPNYEDFEIVIERVGDTNIYAVNVRQPCGGQVGDASSSFSIEEIKAIAPAPAPGSQGDDSQLSRNFKAVSTGGAADYVLNTNSALREPAAKDIGLKLSQALFKNEVLEILGRCKEYCRAKNSTLRIRLDLSRAPELGALPWEYLRSTENDNFVCLDPDTTLVRYLRTADALRPLKVIPPLRILVMAATPQDLPQLAKNVEIQTIRDALRGLTIGNIEINVLPDATISSLTNALEEAQRNDRPIHVFHFIGHGAFSEDRKEGVLVFEDNQQKSQAVGHEDLGRLLKPYRLDLRLVILNACEGARISVTDSYSSVAAKIMQVAEIPAVIAMQFQITDSAAIIFAKSFYGRLANGENLETAIDSARQAVNNPQEYQNSGRNMPVEKEWATPVFYLRANDGHLFDVKIPKPPPELTGHYNAVKTLLPTCNLVVFLGLGVNLLNRPFYDSWEPGKGLPSATELYSYLSRTYRITPVNNSLAGLTQQLQLLHKLSSDEFVEIFKNSRSSSKLYQVLGSLTNKITGKLPDEVVDPFHCAMLFVTTTYDSALENAFEEAGITDYNIVCYNQDEEENWIFSHKQYKDKKLVTTIPLIAPNNPNEYTGLRNKLPVILKLPGEIKYESSYAITEDHFFAFAHKGLSELLPADLLGQIRTSRHLYLGYELQNWTLRLIWNRICENQNKVKRENSLAIVFDHEADPSALFWAGTNVPMATVSLEDYVAGLEENVLNQLG